MNSIYKGAHTHIPTRENIVCWFDSEMRMRGGGVEAGE